MTTPTTTNQAATDLNKIIAAGNSAGCQALIVLATADQPWLATPGVKRLFTWGVGWLSKYISKAEQQGVTFLVIDAQVAHEQHEVAKAWAALVAAQKSGNADAIKKATQDYADAHSALVNCDGSAQPV